MAYQLFVNLILPLRFIYRFYFIVIIIVIMLTIIFLGLDLADLVQHSDVMTGHKLMLDCVISPLQRTTIEQDPRNIRNISPAMPGGDPNHLGY